MNGQEYLQAVQAQFESDGWQVQSKQLDSDVVLLRGQRSGGSVLCMVVNGEASGAHVQRLAELGDDAGVSNLAIAAKGGYDTAASTVIDQHGVRTIDVGGASSTGGSTSSTDDSESGARQVSRRTAVFAIAGAGVAGVGGFYLTSGGVGLPSFGDGVGVLPVVELRPEFEEFSVESGTVTPVPEEVGATEIEVEATILSETEEEELELEFVGVTFADSDGTILGDVDLRVTQTLPAEETTTYSGTFDIETPPDWSDVSEVYATFSIA